MLVLLIIFMVTAPLLNLGVDIQLPQSKAKSVQNDKEPAVVSVDKDGKLYLTLGGPARTDRAGRAGGARLGVRARKPAVAVSHRRRPARGLRPHLPGNGAAATGGVAKVGLMSQPNPAQDAH